MVAGGLADRETVKGHEARGIGRRDEGAPNDVSLIARELAPEERFQVHVLAHCDCADVGDRRGGVRHRRVELSKIAGADE